MKELSRGPAPCLDGYLIPWRMDEDQPQLLEIEGTNFIPVFSTEEKLNEAMALLQVRYSIKQISEERTFLESVLPHARVMIDPWINEAGNTRWLEPSL
jgi:hypothetical protein